MKKLSILLFISYLLPAYSQDSTSSSFCHCEKIWRNKKNEISGTFENPTKMILVPKNCIDSLLDENYIYTWRFEKQKDDSVKKWHKIRMYRENYYVSVGILTDSFVINMDETLLEFKHSPLGYNLTIIKEGYKKPFSLDIDIPGLNMLISRGNDGEIIKTFRSDKK